MFHQFSINNNAHLYECLQKTLIYPGIEVICLNASSILTIL